MPAFLGDLQAGLHNENTVLLFGAFLRKTRARNQGRGRECLAPNTVLKYCSFVRTHLSMMHGFPFGNAESPRWRRFARGLLRERPHQRRECRGLRAAHLRHAYSELTARGEITVSGLNEWAMLATGRVALCRPSEIGAITRADLTFATEPEPHAVLLIAPLKKRPGAGGKTPCLIARGDGSGADAYWALSELVKHDQVLPEHAQHTPLFRNSQRAAFTPAQIAASVRRIVAACGEDISAFSGRSLRIGGATDLHAAGGDPYVIQLAGRWDSAAHRAYSRATIGQMLRFSRQLQHAGADPALEDQFAEYAQPAP